MLVQGLVRVRWYMQNVVGLAMLFALAAACTTTNPAPIECSLLVLRPTAVDVSPSDSSCADLAARAFGESLEVALRQGGVRVVRDDGARTEGSLILSTVITSCILARIGEESDNAAYFELAGFFAVSDHRGTPLFVGRIPSAASAGERGVDDEWRRHVAHLSAACLAEELLRRLHATPCVSSMKQHTGR